MKLTPGVGASEVPFGMQLDDLLRLLGKPNENYAIPDIKGYPKSRCVLYYKNCDFLLTPEQGVIAITVEAGKTTIELWDTVINCLSPSEFANFLSEKECDPVMAEPDGWGDQDVESMACGIIASFCEGELEEIELNDRIWRKPDR